MKIKTLHALDKYIGTSICAVLSIFCEARRSICSRGRKKPVKKILFIELAEMGSVILADPAMRRAQNVFSADCFFVIFEKNRGALDILQTIDPENIFTISIESICNIVRDTMKFIFWARKKKIDTVVDFELFSRFSTILSFFSGAQNIAAFHKFDGFNGEGLYRGNITTHKVRYNPQKHVSENFMSLITALECDICVAPQPCTADDIKLAQAHVDTASQQHVLSLIKSRYNALGCKKIILINPNASEFLPQRKWGIENYAELARKILKIYENTLILITGDYSEHDEAERLVKLIGSVRCINFSGMVTTRELPALYSLSNLMISNDSGAAHFASTTNLQKIVLFGPETPVRYCPLGKTEAVYLGLPCSPCVNIKNYRHTACKNNACMQGITVDMILSIVKKVLTSCG